MLKAIRHHWPEYLMESTGLGIFMISAGLFKTLLEYPAETRRDSFDRLTGIFGTNMRLAALRLGGETVQLVEYRTPPGREVPSDSQRNDGESLKQCDRAKPFCDASAAFRVLHLPSVNRDLKRQMKP